MLNFFLLPIATAGLKTKGDPNTGGLCKSGSSPGNIAVDSRLDSEVRDKDSSTGPESSVFSMVADGAPLLLDGIP